MKLCIAFLLEIALLVRVAKAQDPLCRNGIAGLFGVAAACCAASCGTCGGSGCSRRPGGGDNCCGGSINAANRNCDLVNPPCIIQRDPQCETGLANQAAGVCCAGNCEGTCGGVSGGGCENAFSGSADTSSRCCAADILAANRPCSQFAPPCTLDGGGPAPVPAPVPAPDLGSA